MLFEDLEDFKNTVINITFKPDEGTSDNIILAAIPVNDDDINEGVQLFIVQLELVSSLNPHKINFVSRATSLCRIIDDDRKSL